jgi:hypothetical protein
MLCIGGECTKSNRGEFTGVCILRELLSLWDKGGFYSRFRVTEQVVKKKLEKSYERYKKLCSLRTLMEINKIKEEQYKTKIESFIKEANCIFPVYKTDILKLIRDDENRDKQAKTEDIEFLKRAFKGEMVKFDTGKDKSYQEKIIVGEKRMVDIIESMRREEQHKKEKQEMSKKKAIKDMMERMNDFEIELSSSGTSATDTDSEFEPCQKKKKISEDRVYIELSMNDVFDKWVPFLTRYKVSVRAETSLLSSLFKVGGVDLNTVPVSKSSLHRNKKIVIENEARIVREENLDKVWG